MTRLLIVLQTTDIEEMGSVEELILAQNQLKIIDAGFQELKLEPPDWVLEKLSETGHEINMRVKGELMKRLKSAKARRSALRTADEKRKDLDAEIAELESKLS